MEFYIREKWTINIEKWTFDGQAIITFKIKCNYF